MLTVPVKVTCPHGSPSDPKFLLLIVVGKLPSYRKVASAFYVLKTNRSGH